MYRSPQFQAFIEAYGNVTLARVKQDCPLFRRDFAPEILRVRARSSHVSIP